MMRRTLLLVGLAGITILATSKAVAQSSIESLEKELSALARRVSRAVVTVEGGALAAPETVPQGEWLYSNPNRPWTTLLRLFNLPSPITRRGSGCIISTEGWILTSADIVRGVETCVVRLAEGRREIARVVSIDDLTNLALLRVNAALPGALPLGDSDQVEQGSLVACIGTIGGYEQSLALCVVAGKERAAVIDNQQFLTNLLQISGAVGAGSSGAPVVNVRGELVGIIVAAIATSSPTLDLNASRASVGRGAPSGEPLLVLSSSGALAVPINDVKAVLSEMQAGRLRRPYLGIMPADRDGAEGAEVVRVVAGSPAERAGIRLGDVIRTMNGVSIRRAADVSSLLRRMKPGERLVIDVIRGAQRLRLTVVLAERTRNTP